MIESILRTIDSNLFAFMAAVWLAGYLLAVLWLWIKRVIRDTNNQNAYWRDQ